MLREQGIQRVIVAFAPGRDSELLGLLRHCVAEGVQVDIVPRFYELVGPSPRANSVGGLALMEIPARGLTGPSWRSSAASTSWARSGCC